MQRPSDPGRSGGKRGKGKRGAGRTLLAVGVPLAAAALFVALLVYASRTFSQAVLDYEDRKLLEMQTADGTAALPFAEQPRRRHGGGGAAAAAGGGMQLSSLAAAADTALDQAEGGSRRSSWLTAALLWAEEHQQQRLKAQAEKQHPQQARSGCGLLPCQQAQLARPRTLVIYTYAAADPEQRANFEHFLRYGVEEHEWLRYRIIISSGTGILPPASQPQLPPNAHYIHTDACTTGAWGIIAAVAPQLEAELAAAQQIVVVGSEARGPFMPSYTQQFMHWTDAFTSRLTRRTKLVGAALTCEGAPKGGDAADEWRLNPFMLPYAWATDKEGWQLMAGTAEVFQCYSSPWDARYHSDAGAALALLSAGYNLDTLLAKYQGMDWWNQRSWECNQRVRPDAEWSYDGISISPYETVFVPVSQGLVQSEWSFVRQAAKYSAWMDAQAAGAPQGNPNPFVTDQWALRGQRIVYQNTRGPGCFDFAYYVEHNPDLRHESGQHAKLWEHFVLLGQFQGMQHRFTCPLQLGNSYRAAYMRARGRRCFDHNHYSKNNQDVRMAGVGEASQLFGHYAEYGQFEMRAARFVCTDLLPGLPAGFDTRPLDPLPKDGRQKNEEKWKGLAAAATAQAEAGLDKLRRGGGVSAETAAELAALEKEAAAKAAEVAATKKNVDVAAAAAAAEAAIEKERQAAMAAMRAQQQQQVEGVAAAAAAGDVAAGAVAAAQQQAAVGAAAAGEAGGQQQQQQQQGGEMQQQQAGQMQQQQAEQAEQVAEQAQQLADPAQQAQQQQAGQEAGEVQQQQQQQQQQAGEMQQQVAVGDASSAAAYERIQAADAEAALQQQQVQAAAGGAGVQAAP